MTGSASQVRAAARDQIRAAAARFLAENPPPPLPDAVRALLARNVARIPTRTSTDIPSADAA